MGSCHIKSSHRKNDTETMAMIGSLPGGEPAFTGHLAIWVQWKPVLLIVII